MITTINWDDNIIFKCFVGFGMVFWGLFVFVLGGFPFFLAVSDLLVFT